MNYNETICYPGWDVPKSNHRTKKCLEGYLRWQDIVPIKIKVKGDNRLPECEYSDCLTGRQIQVLVDNMYISHMEYLGFYPK